MTADPNLILMVIGLFLMLLILLVIVGATSR